LLNPQELSSKSEFSARLIRKAMSTMGVNELNPKR